MGAPLRLAVLISGSGSNLKALIDARQAGRLDLEFVQVIANREAAGGLDHARAAGIPWTVINADNTDSEEGEDQALRECLDAAQPDLVLLSGYMRVLGPELVAAFTGRIVNQHPSLLPRFKGLDTYHRVLAAGDEEHGASVHFVTAELDDGPVIAQVRVPVLAGDDPQALAARLGPEEHRLLEAVMELFIQRRVSMVRGGVEVDGRLLDQPLELRDGVLQS